MVISSPWRLPPAGWLALALAGFTAGCVHSDGQTPMPEARSAERKPLDAAALEDKKTASTKVSRELIVLYEEFVAHRASGSTEPFQPRGALIRIRDERVLIDFSARGEGQVLRQELQSLGVSEATAFRDMVSGWLPIEAIPRLGQLEHLRVARAARAVTQQP